MKQLLLLRHAKSSWQDPRLDDHQRPLNPRGERDAPRMGRWIVEKDMEPQLIISSSALRAQQTASAVAGCCENGPTVQRTDRLYLAPPADYLAVLADLDESFSRVLLVGHNPGISELVERLSGETAEMPTAALAVFHSEADSWMAIESADIQMVGYWVPKQLDI